MLLRFFWFTTKSAPSATLTAAWFAFASRLARCDYSMRATRVQDNDKF